MSDLSDDNYIEEKPDHYYRTEIPNFIFDILNPIQLAVYSHIKRICGDSGRCWMSMKNLAKKIGIGETMLRETLKELDRADFLIRGKLIDIIRRKKPDGSQDSNIIRINDVWRINGDIYRGQLWGGGTSPGEGGVPQTARGGTSPREDKEEHSQEEPSKENKQTEPQASDAVVVCFSAEEKQSYERKLELLRPYKLADSYIHALLAYDLDRLTQSVAAAIQWAKRRETRGDPVCELGRAFLSAAAGNWKSYQTQEDIDLEHSKQIDALEALVSENRMAAEKLQEAYNKTVRFDDQMTLHGQTFMIPTKIGEYRSFLTIDLAEPDSIERIKRFIEQKNT